MAPHPIQNSDSESPQLSRQNTDQELKVKKGSGSRPKTSFSAGRTSNKTLEGKNSEKLKSEEVKRVSKDLKVEHKFVKNSRNMIRLVF